MSGMCRGLKISFSLAEMCHGRKRLIFFFFEMAFYTKKMNKSRNGEEK
jgi:hypothetical protein